MKLLNFFLRLSWIFYTWIEFFKLQPSVSLYIGIVVNGFQIMKLVKQMQDTARVNTENKLWWIQEFNWLSLGLANEVCWYVRLINSSITITLNYMSCSLLSLLFHTIKKYFCCFCPILVVWILKEFYSK